MAVAAILAGGAFDLIRHLTSHGTSKNTFQQLKQEFQQLGSDLQAGNLSQAQSDFAALQQKLPGASPANASLPSTGQNTLPAALAQLSQDLQAGNLSAAQSDFAAVQQDVQQIGQQQAAGGAHHHHHHPSGNFDSSNLSSSQQQAISALFSQLGQSLQSGNLSAAQQAYTALQQDFQQFVQGNSSGVNPSASSSLSVSA